MLVPADRSWPDRFEAHRTELATSLGAAAVRIDHVGSTAVPGLPAQPVLDVLVSVPDLADAAAYEPALQRLGLEALPGSADPRRYGAPPTDSAPGVLVHVCAAGGPTERANLLFTAFLRAHPVHADSYLHHKDELRLRVGHDPAAYAAAKGGFVAAVLDDAERWAAAHGWSP